MAPLLRGGPLSKDAVSRLVGRLAEDFETWRHRDLAADAIQYLMLDGWYPKVRIGKRRVRVPVLVTLGVRADGDRVMLDVRLVGDESTAAWRDVIRSLVARQIGLAHAGGDRRQSRDWRRRSASSGRRWRFNAARRTSCATWRPRRRRVCAKSSPKSIGG